MAQVLTVDDVWIGPSLPHGVGIHVLPVAEHNYLGIRRRIIGEMTPFIAGEFNITDIKKATYSELFESEEAAADTYYKIKLVFTTLDEVKGTEKKTAVKKNFSKHNTEKKNEAKNSDSKKDVSKKDTAKEFHKKVSDKKADIKAQKTEKRKKK